MNIKQAVNAMVMNPSINFPWETDVVALVNSFLPPEGQLNPITVTPSELVAAIDGLSPDISEMVYKATLDAAPVTLPQPAAIVPAPPAVVGSVKDQSIFIWVGLFMTGFALLTATKLIDGSVFLELVKVLVPVLLNQSSDGS